MSNDATTRARAFAGRCICATITGKRLTCPLCDLANALREAERNALRHVYHLLNLDGVEAVRLHIIRAVQPDVREGEAWEQTTCTCLHEHNPGCPRYGEDEP